MHFRLQVFVQGIFLQGGPDGLLEVLIRTPRATQVRVGRGELYGQPTSDGRSVATATCQISPNPRVTQAFRELAEGRLPSDTPSESVDNWARFQAADGLLRRDTVLPVSGLPENIASFILQTRRDLFAAISRSCELLRWRHNLDGPHFPFQGGPANAQWSLDGTEWHLLPGDTGIRLYPVSSVYPTRSLQDGLQALLDSDEVEPIAHRLLREASDNRFVNRRSALVLGVAALEVGLKAFLGTAVPAADWLVANLPTPPVKRILAEYLPTLATRLQIAGRVVVPGATIGWIDKAVLLRNRVAHVTGEDVEYERLEEMLVAIQDTLWLFDYYAGRSWALAHLSERCRQSLGIQDGVIDA